MRIKMFRTKQQNLPQVENNIKMHEVREVKNIPRIRGSTLQTMRKKIFKKQKGICQCCSRVLLFEHSEDGFELDHIIPLSEGGDNNKTNFQILCLECHRQKTAEEIRRYHKREIENLEKINIRKNVTVNVDTIIF